jgi:Arc/MetJ-type ribon-helix-helix transcriptional regulator
MSKRNKVRVSITLPSDLVEWAKNAVKEGKYAGVRSFSGLVELLLKREMDKYENK